MEIDFSQSAPTPTTLYECHTLIVSLWNFCAELQKEVLGLKKELVVNVDETSHKEQHQRRWTWVVATSFLCVFFVSKRRKMEMAQEILGKLFKGVLISDCYSSYNWVDFRQLCWFHLKRDLKTPSLLREDLLLLAA